jgi:3-phenylpropionate/trans-cinnamate dioxygenase ferredoxin component
VTDYVPVAAASSIPPGQVQSVEVDGRRLALCHVEGQGFYAIDDVCTHDGGPLYQGELEDEQIECPRHGARFNVMTGEVVTLPATTPVHSYDVRVEGDTVLVNPTPKPIRRKF